jgi:hypothetical protein
MVPLIAFICVLEHVRQRKKIFNRKTSDFSFSSVWFLIFSQKFSSYNSAWILIRIRIRIRTFCSDSDPAKTFGLFRIRIHNTAVRYPYLMAWETSVVDPKQFFSRGAKRSDPVSDLNFHFFRMPSILKVFSWHFKKGIIMYFNVIIIKLIIF